MDTFFWVLLIFLAAKVGLELFFPKINSSLNKAIKIPYIAAKGYYEYCKQFW